MFRTLMTTRRFAPLFWCQFFSAFNDNFVRNMLAMLILFRFGGENASLKILLGAIVFLLPSIPLSALGGEIADSHDKAFVARRLKLAEIFVQMIAAAGFALDSPMLLYVALFGLGVIGALFGPVKYGMLPDHLRRDELVAGNGLIESATFAAIICGLVFGGLAAAEGRSTLGVVAQLALIALACYGAALFIPQTGVRAPGLKITRNVLASTLTLIRELYADDRQWVCAIGVNWFWMMGVVTLSLVPVIIKSRAGGGIEVEIAINLFFAIGVAAGSLGAAALSHGRIELALSPFLLLAMAALAIHMGLSTAAMPLADHEVPLIEFFTESAGLRIAIEILLYSAAGGLFVVPLFAAVQAWAEESRRARVVAAVYTLDTVWMIGASLVTIILLQTLHLSEPMALAALGFADVAAAIFFFRRLPARSAAFALRFLWRTLFRLELVGRENLRTAGQPAVIAVNHVSWLDAPIVFSLMETAPLFAFDPNCVRRWPARLFLALAEARPLDPARPQGLRALSREVSSGRPLVLLVDGAAALAGHSMKSFETAALIAEGSGALVTPVRLAGAERTIVSRFSAAHVGRRLLPKIRVTILPPRRLATSAGLRGRAGRRAAAAALFDRMAELAFLTADTRRTLFAAFEASAKIRGLSRVAVQDPVDGAWTLRRFRIGVGLLARKLAALSEPGEKIGLMLPNANGAALAFMALQAAGRVPAMLNFTSGAHNLVSACAEAEIRLVVASRAFVRTANLKGEIEAIEARARIVWLEDLHASVTAIDHLRAALSPGRALARSLPDDPAVVLFTSGSEGAPKGVALSHANLLANVAQVASRFDLRLNDVCFNPMPIFHALGLTGGLLLGLIGSMRVYLYPTPLRYRQIPELIGSVGATVLIGADTFLAGYGRYASASGFPSLRYVIAGAEAVKDETRRLYQEKFGVRILEGYGATETSPVLAVNAPAFNKIGTVGRLLPFVEPRLEPAPGVEEGGRLIVRGPNVMIGYYRADNPGELEPPPGGWHDTGDIVVIDEQGFVSIKGRAKRFIKVAGETVSLAMVEEMAAELWPDDIVAAIAAPDPKQGERVVLATTRTGATRAQMQAWMKVKGAAEFMYPSTVVVLDSIPLLGSGKIDHVALVRSLRERGV